jgi:hypothetical protein
MSDLKSCKVKITVSDKKLIQSSQKGKKHMEAMQPNQKNKQVILQEVHYVLTWCATFSCVMSNSAESSSSSLKMTTKKGLVQIILIKSSRVQMVTCLQSRHFQFQDMSTLIRYVFGTNNMGLIISPMSVWHLYGKWLLFVIVVMQEIGSDERVFRVCSPHSRLSYQLGILETKACNFINILEVCTELIFLK